MQAFDTALGCVVMIGKIFDGLAVNEDVLKNAFSGELFAADRANELAAEGVPFRAFLPLVYDPETLCPPDH